MEEREREGWRVNLLKKLLSLPTNQADLTADNNKNKVYSSSVHAQYKHKVTSGPCLLNLETFVGYCKLLDRTHTKITKSQTFRLYTIQIQHVIPYAYNTSTHVFTLYQS